MTEIEPKAWAADQAVIENILRDYHWMARRYADGRSSYAPGLFNDHTDKLINLGLKLNPTAENKLFATDGMFGEIHPEQNLRPSAIEAMGDIYGEP